MVFSHTTPSSDTEKTGGPFDFGPDFDSASVQLVPGLDVWFKVDNVSLQFKARKSEASVPDFALDVVGFSDDKILNVTSKVGGFLQSIDGSGTTPLESGFQPVDDLGIATLPVSDKSEFFIRDPFNSGGDHYKLTQAPVVDSTTWTDYEVELAIYEENVTLGKATDYSMASYFEKLFLDIYPLPSGAEFSDIKLVVEYSPSNALMMHSIGHNVEVMSINDIYSMSPAAMKSTDDYINSNIDTQPLSLIEDIPHGYDSPETIKTNYSRRWRGGTSDILTGAFDPSEYDRSFDNLESTHAFNGFYTNFDRTDGDFFLSQDMGSIDLNASGQILGDTFSNRLIKNIGQRFNSTKKYPSSPRSYNSIDYAGAGHILEGRITDSYSNAVILGSGATLNYGSHGDVSQGFAAFARFTPNAGLDITTGFHRILDNYDGSTGFRVVIANGFFRVNMYDDGAVVRTATDTHPASGYSYPVSLLATYSEHGDQRLRLYADNELAGSGWSVFRDDQTFGFTAAANSGDIITDGNFIMSEVGLSVPCNVVASGASVQDRETTVDALFDSVRAKYWQDGQNYTDDRYKLWDFVNDEISGWHIGAFNYEQFGPAFDQYTRRGSEDYIIHSLTSDGTPYSSLTDIPLPTTVNASGLAYHTQIENDMLRFNLSDIQENNDHLYAVTPRISKTIPRDYKFEERGLVVESVVEHESDVNIPWPWDGFTGEENFGPKIIVSLYARSKDPTTYEAQNRGLVLRKEHYIHPINDSLIKLSTIFTYDDLISNNEEWAEFEVDRSTTELGEKWFPADMQTMFVQYDLAYPSGTAFTSELKLHTVHVGVESALVEAGEVSDTMNLSTSGDIYAYGRLDMHTVAHVAESGLLNMAVSGTPMPVSSGDLNMMTVGHISLGVGPVDTVFTTFSEAYNPTWLPMSLKVAENISAGGDGSENPSLNITMQGIVRPRNDGLNLVLGSGSIDSIVDEVNLFSKGVPTLQDVGDFNLDMYVRGVQDNGTNLNDSMNLIVMAPEVEPIDQKSMNLYINSSVQPNKITSSANLFTYNVLAVDPDIDEQIVIDWTGANYGTGITIRDELNGVAFLPLNDEIRGVTTICYGECDIGGTCTQPAIVTHGIEWQPETCVDGGVANAIGVFSDPDGSGFLTPTPYDNNFYGVRKYTGLVPHATYQITITGRTASDSILDVPRVITEWEYGTNDEVNYSGVKLSQDEPLDTIYPSGRNLGDQYGEAVDVDDDIMAIGSPYYHMYDSEGYELENAGTVFVYRRRPEPTGPSFVEHKASWDLEAKLQLPDGFRRDSYVEVDDEYRFDDGSSFIGKRRLWSVGQEGRQLGHSVAIHKGENRELIITGGPDAKFSRTFPEIVSDPINVAIFVMTNEFVPEIRIPVNKAPDIVFNYETIQENLNGKDALFTYFADPSTVFNVQIVIVEPTTEFGSPTPDFPEPKPDFITKSTIDRHTTYNRLDAAFQAQDDKILQQLKDVYHDRFPLTAGLLHSGIPPILGIYVDNSASLQERAVQPATDRFIEYWKGYTYDNGLKDFDNVPVSGYASYVAKVDENWVRQTNEIIDNVLSTGNMISEDYFDLFANGVGPDFFQSDVESANSVPASGGVVFVFENYDGEWTPVQRIDSPTTASDIKPDRFGHAVDVSNNGETLIIGSPYIDEAVKVFEINKDFSDRAYEGAIGWIRKQSGTYFTNLESDYDAYAQASGVTAANKQIYLDLTPSGKYNYITDESLELYTPSFGYSYTDIAAATTGDWKFLAEKMVPTSRLGYSVATNEDGTIIAAGQPTDSMNFQQAIPVYMRPGVTPENDWWFNYVNAGAVSVWNSRPYYPHGKAVEFTRFGNLFEINNSDNMPAGTFNHFSDIYNNQNIDWEKLPFAQTEIPEDAGLVFMITPAEDAVSDEIVDNIENWLALGDRHLVLVANDPLFEDNGAYTESTSIVNALLRRLESRITVQPAKTQYEACVSGVPYEINAMPSFQPHGGFDSIGLTTNLVGSGYADLRLYYEGLDLGYNCQYDPVEFVDPLGNEVNAPQYWEINDKCSTPLQHLGDLRGQWNDICMDLRAEPVIYIENLPRLFGTYTPTQCSYNIAGGEDLGFAQGEPLPMLAAAENPPPRTVVYPAVPEKITEEYGIVGYTPVSVGKAFAEEDSGEVSFALAYNSGELLNFNTNLGNTGSSSRWYNPDFYNDKDAILQAKADSKLESTNYPYQITDTLITMAEEYYGNDGSSVVLYNQLATENPAVADGSNGDRNQNLYANLVGKDNEGSSKVAQLNGSLNVAQFVEGYQSSNLQDMLIRNGNTVDQGVTFDDLALTQNGYNVAWIANTSETISDHDLDLLKSWLATGDKKLIITYGPSVSLTGNGTRKTSLQNANAAKYICQQLGLTMQPLFLPGKNRLAKSHIADSETTAVSYPDIAISNFQAQQSFNLMKLEQSSYISTGYPGLTDTSISSVNFGGSNKLVDDMVPISLGNANRLAYFDVAITDNNYQNVGVPELKTGIASLKIPALPGSGYRLYFALANESEQETSDLTFQFGDVLRNISVNPADRVIPEEATIPVLDIDNITNEKSVIVDEVAYKTSLILDSEALQKAGGTTGRVYHKTVDVLVPNNGSGINIYMDGNKVDFRLPPEGQPYDPIYTPRIVAVSGALVDIVEVVEQQPIYGVIQTIEPAVPEREVVVDDETRPIIHGSNQYCPDDSNLPEDEQCGTYFISKEGEDPKIEDGPVVVAQELYFNRPFDAGLNRSRITVIADPSLIEGETILASGGSIRPEVSAFLSSLYPESAPANYGEKTYDTYDRIVALDRSSPHKLYAATANSGVVVRFEGDTSGYANSGQALNLFSDTEQDVNSSNKFKVKPVAEGEPQTYLVPREAPILDVQLEENGQIALFNSQTYSWGATTKFSGVYEGEMYGDASYLGGMPQIMKDHDVDYLDFRAFPSGYPGDLFGYSISLFGNKLLVGSPFATWETEDGFTKWSEATSGNTLSGAVVGHNGGAGAAFLYELNGSGLDPLGNETRWGLTRKFRPSGINTGQDLTDSATSQAYKYLGLNSYTDAELAQWSTKSDMFGYDVDIEYDLLAISAPGHDFNNVMDVYSGAFQRKSFNPEFDIRSVKYTDMGASGVRDELSSGTAILNNGAVFTYQNNITDWSAKSQSWESLQKVTAQGYNSDVQGTSENINFGHAIALDRGLRSDGDYTMAVGTPSETYGTSGVALTDAGAAYAYDAMLRTQPPSVADSGSWINAVVYGNKPLDPDASTSIAFYNGVIPNERVTEEGYVVADKDGQIFIEVSGQDMVEKGYVVHRPSIEAVQGYMLQGEPIFNNLRLATVGRGPEVSGDMNLYIGSEYGPVYNNIGLYAGAVLGIPSGEMNLVSWNPSGIPVTSTVNMVASGAGLNTDELTLRVRGK